MTDTTNSTAQPLSTAVQKVFKLLGEVTGKRIALDTVGGSAFELAIELFKRGAHIVVADRDKSRIQALNRILFEMSGSVNRYRTVPFGNIMFEPVEILLALDKEQPETPSHAAFQRKITLDDIKQVQINEAGNPGPITQGAPITGPAAAASNAQATAQAATQAAAPQDQSGGQTNKSAA